MTFFIRICLSLFLVHSSVAHCELQNLGVLKHQITHYYDSGRYASELKNTIDSAHQYIIQQSLAQKNSKHRLALVLDIDETSITNADKILARDFMGNSKLIHMEIMKADSPAIKPMLKLYNDAKRHGLKVFFVTGRVEAERDATVKNLKKAGYSGWSGLYLRPANYKRKSIVPFKSQARADIIKKGYTVIATIGDQNSDIKGGYAQKGFKLPNPFYFIP